MKTIFWSSVPWSIKQKVVPEAKEEKEEAKGIREEEKNSILENIVMKILFFPNNGSLNANMHDSWEQKMFQINVNVNVQIKRDY